MGYVCVEEDVWLWPRVVGEWYVVGDVLGPRIFPPTDSQLTFLFKYNLLIEALVI